MSDFLLSVVSMCMLLSGAFVCIVAKKNRCNAAFVSLSLFIYIFLTTFFWGTNYFTDEGVNEAVLYHLSYGLSGAGYSEYFWMIAGVVFLLLLGAASSWFFLVLFFRRRGTQKKFFNLLAIILVFTAFFLSPASKDWMELYQEREKSEVLRTEAAAVPGVDYEEYYRTPRLVKRTEGGKRNFVFIYVEGLERTYFDESIFPGLIKGLRDLESHSKTFTEIENTYGSSWTIAGIVASQCSIPLVTASGGNSMSGMNRFLSGAVCLGDLLHAEGYELSFLGGASLNFAGKGNFFKTHGFEDVRGREELIPLLEDSSYRTGWGLYDDSLLEIAYAQFMELSSSDKPFGQFLLTLDTHHPKGHISDKYSELFYKDGSNSMLNAVAVSDYLVSQFVNKIIESPYGEDTVIVITSDHLAMKNRATSLLEKGKRRNLLMIIDPRDKTPQEIKQRGVALDIGPTVLNLLGFDGEIGLGRDLLKQEISLVQEIENFHHVLASWKEEIAAFWDIYPIDDLKIDADAQTVAIKSDLMKFPVLITFDDQMEMNVFFEFESPKKLYDYVYELEKGTPFVWIDEAWKMDGYDPRLKLKRGGYTVIGGKSGAIPVVSSIIRDSYTVSRKQLGEILSSEGNQRTYEKQKRGLWESHVIAEIKALAADVPRRSIIFYSVRKKGEFIQKYFELSKYFYKKLAYTNSIPENKKFYFLSKDIDAVKENGTYRWKRHPLGETLPTLIKRHEGDTIIFSVRDEASSALSEDTIDFLSRFGLNLKDLAYRGSFAAVVDKGEVIAQKVDNTASVFLSSPLLQSMGIDRVESAGLPFGNYSSILIEGREMSHNHRGINLLIMTEDGQRIPYHFDTFSTEKMYEDIWVAAPK